MSDQEKVEFLKATETTEPGPGVTQRLECGDAVNLDTIDMSRRDGHGRVILEVNGREFLVCERCGSLHREYLIPFPVLEGARDPEPEAVNICKKCFNKLAVDIRKHYQKNGFLFGLAKFFIGRYIKF